MALEPLNDRKIILTATLEVDVGFLGNEAAVLEDFEKFAKMTIENMEFRSGRSVFVIRNVKLSK